MEYMTETVTFNFTPWELVHMKQLFERTQGKILTDSETMNAMEAEYKRNPGSPLLLGTQAVWAKEEGE